jgi:prepilin-type N-terminal cleavage/methylation domain-containing protein
MNSISGQNIKSTNRAFTIVELLVSITIIGILAAITIITYRGITNRAIAA